MFHSWFYKTTIDVKLDVEEKFITYVTVSHSSIKLAWLYYIINNFSILLSFVNISGLDEETNKYLCGMKRSSLHGLQVKKTFYGKNYQFSGKLEDLMKW